MHWIAVAATLCSVGLLKEFKPAEPFLFNYLVEYGNFSQETLYGDVFPYSTYSYLIALIPVFIITDLLRYKPVVVLGCVAISTTYALIAWAETVWLMQIMQIVFGVASACEVAYYAY